MPTFASRPTSPDRSSTALGTSIVALEVRYGFSSTIRELGGASMPTSVAASETSWLAPWPRAGGSSVRNEISLIDRLGRSTWSPQVCCLPGP